MYMYLMLSCLGALQLLCIYMYMYITSQEHCVHSREGLSVCRGGWCSLSCERSGRTRGRRSARPHAHHLSPAYSYPPESRTDKSSCVDPALPGGVCGGGGGGGGGGRIPTSNQNVFFTHDCAKKFVLNWLRGRPRPPGHTHQEVDVELEVAWELEQELMHAVQPLQEHGAALAGVRGRCVLPAAVAETMAEAQPLPLYQHLETLGEGGGVGGEGGGVGGREEVWGRGGEGRGGRGREVWGNERGH